MITILSLTNSTHRILYTPRLGQVAFLGKNSMETTIAEISSSFPNLVTVSRENPIDRCMEKMLAADVRHLLVRADKAQGVPAGGWALVSHPVHGALLAREGS